MKRVLFAASARHDPRRAVTVLVLVGIASLGAASLTALSASAAPSLEHAPATIGVAAQPGSRMEPFDATGLPSGPVRGVPARSTLPPGFNLKHAHGGPTYVYVLAGSMDVIDADGSQATYHAGDFFWEPVATRTPRNQPKEPNCSSCGFWRPGQKQLFQFSSGRCSTVESCGALALADTELRTRLRDRDSAGALHYRRIEHGSLLFEIWVPGIDWSNPHKVTDGYAPAWRPNQAGV